MPEVELKDLILLEPSIEDLNIYLLFFYELTQLLFICFSSESLEISSSLTARALLDSEFSPLKPLNPIFWGTCIEFLCLPTEEFPSVFLLKQITDDAIFALWGMSLLNLKVWEEFWPTNLFTYPNCWGPPASSFIVRPISSSLPNPKLPIDVDEVLVGWMVDFHITR